MPDILAIMIQSHNSFKISKRLFQPYLMLGVNVFHFTPSISQLLDYWLKDTGTTYYIDPNTDVIEFHR